MRQTVYLHADRETRDYEADQWRLSKEATLNYRHALTEVAAEVEIDESTGKVKVLRFECDGKAYYATEAIL